MLCPTAKPATYKESLTFVKLTNCFVLFLVAMVGTCWVVECSPVCLKALLADSVLVRWFGHVWHTAGYYDNPSNMATCRFGVPFSASQLHRSSTHIATPCL